MSQETAVGQHLNNNAPILEPQVRAFYKLLGHGESPDSFSDVRCILVDGPLLNDAIEKFQKGHEGRKPNDEELKKIKVVNRSLIRGENAIVEWAKKYNGKGNCFVGRTARTAEGSLKEFRTITADIDPNRERGTSADESLQGKAVKAGRALLSAIRGGYLASSGNGVLVIYRLSEPVAAEFEAFAAKFRAFEGEMRKFLPEGVTLDATHDTARMVKLLGTVSTKGDRANWRHSRFIDFPNKPYLRNDIRARIETCGNVAKQEVKIPSASSLGYKSRSEAVFGLAAFCKARGVSREATLAALEADPFLRGRPDDNKRVIEKIFNGEQERGDSGFRQDRKEDVAPLQVSQPGDHLDDHRKRLYDRKNHPNPEISTGVEMVDRLTWGLRRGEIFTIAARPSIGKTSISVSIAARMARAGKRVLFFTSEMSTDTTYDRLLQVLSEVPGDKFNTGSFTDEDRQRIDAAYDELKRLGPALTICDKTSPTIWQVRSTAEENKPDLVIYDHIQHIGGDSDSQRDKVSQFVRGLKDISREFNCSVLALSQIRRLYRDKEGKELRPTLSDLKESGTIEEESAAVLLLSIIEDSPSNPIRNLYAELAKNRFGPLAILGIEFNKLTCDFKDMEAAEPL